MSLKDVREKIKSILETVPGIGLVHDYERLASDWPSFLSFFKPDGTDLVNGWTITRTASSETPQAGGQHVRQHKMLIKGYYSQKDKAGSEKAFQDLLEAVCDRLRSQAGSAFGPPQVEVVELRLFGEVLCHYGEVSLLATEETTFIPAF